MRTAQLLLFTVLVFSALLSRAESNIRVDGFASFVGGFTVDETPYNTSGYDKDLRFDRDSLFAVQIKSDMGDNLAATVQILGKADTGYDAEMEWAYLTYQAAPKWRIKLGKFRAPLYLYSEHLDVGYAYHWITPPSLVYDVPTRTLQGFSVEYLRDIGNWNSRLNFVAANGKDDYHTNGEDTFTQLRGVLGLNWSLNYEWLTFSAVYSEIAKTSIPIRGIYDDSNPANPLSIAGGLNAAAANPLLGLQADHFSSLIEDMRINDDKARFAALGFQAEYGNYLFVGEITRVHLNHSISPDEKSAYLSAGRYFGKTLLHLSYEKDDEAAKTQLSDFVKNSLPAGVDPQLDALINAVEGAVKAQEFNSTAWTLGARYDFHPTASLKLEYKHQKDKSRNETAGLVLFGVDLVF